MKGYLYFLECSNGQYYTGSTINVGQRFLKHQAGKGANFTNKHRPVKLIFLKEYPTIQEAFKWEKQIQGWSRKKKEAFMTENYKILHRLAECQNDSHFKNKTIDDQRQQSDCSGVMDEE